MATKKVARQVLAGLAVAGAVATGLSLWPFVSALLLASVLAATLGGVHRWVAARLGGRARLSAMLLTLGVLLALVAPVGGIGTYVVREAIAGARYVRETLASEGSRGLVEKVPRPLRSMAQRIADGLDEEGLSLSALSDSQQEQAASAAKGLFRRTARLMVSTAMMLIAFFFLLVDRGRLVAWLDQTVPLERGQFGELLADFHVIAISIVLSSLVTAGAQSVVALGGYLLAGVASPAFFALVTFVIAFIPAIGGAGATLAVAALQLASGRTGAAIFLAVWGIVVVGLVDNVLKPLVLKGKTEMHAGLVFFVLFGGLTMFGPIGLVVGPLALAFLVSTVRIYRREHGADRSGPPEPEAEPSGGAS